MMQPDNQNSAGSRSINHQALVEQGTAISTDVSHPNLGMHKDDGDIIDLREYWNILVKRKWMVFGFFTIVVIAVITATMLKTPIFRATTVLQIERESAKVVQYDDASTPTISGNDKDFYQTQYELLKSQSLAQRVIEQLRLGKTASRDVRDKSLWEWLSENITGSEKATDGPSGASEEAQRNVQKTLQIQAFLGALTVEPIRSSRLVKVSFDNPDPKVAAQVANAIADNFIGITLERRFEATSYAKTFLEDRIRQVKQKLEESERAQVDYARSMQLFSADKDGATTNSQILMEFNAAHARAQQERIKAKSLYEQMQSSTSGNLPQIMDNQLILLYKSNKAKLESEYQDKLRTYKPGYPMMQELSSKIAEVTAQLEREQKNVRTSIHAAYEAALKQEALLNEKLNTSKKEMLDMQSRSIQYNIIKREADTNRQLYDGLLQRLKEVSVAGGVGTNNVSVVDRAEVPLVKFKPNLGMNLMIAIFVGLFGGAGLAFLFEYLDDTFKQLSDIEKKLGIPVLGLIPQIKGIADSSGILQQTMDDPRSVISEAYRSTRTALQFSSHEGAPRIFSLTSTTMGEGKSISAMSLAIQFAQFGSSVLLIDADLRAPSQHKIFGINNSTGLSNYLTGTAQAVDITQNTPVSNLFIIPTGPLPPNPAELLGGKKMAELMDLARTRFDHIIIDSPPILGLADALIIAKSVDSVLLVVQAFTTRCSAVQSALKRMHVARIRPLGCLLTKVHKHTHGYAYEYYYSYSGKSEKEQLASQI